DVVDTLNLLTVDLINNLVAELRGISVDWIRQDVAENDNLLPLSRMVSEDKIIEIEMQPQIIRIVFSHKVGVDRLEDQPPEDNKAWFFVISLRLQGKRPRVRQWNRNNDLFSIAKNLQIHLFPFEFAFDHFGHFDRRPVHGDGTITRNGQTVDRQQHVSRLQASFGHAAAVDASNENAAFTIGESQSSAHRRVMQRMIGDSEIHV